MAEELQRVSEAKKLFADSEHIAAPAMKPNALYDARDTRVPPPDKNNMHAGGLEGRRQRERAREEGWKRNSGESEREEGGAGGLDEDAVNRGGAGMSRSEEGGGGDLDWLSSLRAESAARPPPAPAPAAGGAKPGNSNSRRTSNGQAKNEGLSGGPTAVESEQGGREGGKEGGRRGGGERRQVHADALAPSVVAPRSSRLPARAAVKFRGNVAEVDEPCAHRPSGSIRAYANISAYGKMELDAKRGSIGCDLQIGCGDLQIGKGLSREVLAMLEEVTCLSNVHVSGGCG